MVQIVDVDVPHVTGGAWPVGRYLIIFLAGIIFFLGFDLIDGHPFNGDPDDLMRSVQVRTLLDTGNWFDMSIPSVRMPEVYVSPWSRLADLPYVLIAGALGSIAGQERALWLAFQIWPPAMALVYALLVIAILRRIVPAERDLPVSTLLGIVIFSVYAIWEFSPGRIDHHSIQILLMLAMIYGIARWDVRGGLMVGGAVSMAVAVGLETLPLVAASLVALVAAWSLGAKGSAGVLRSVGVATVVSAVMLMTLLISPAHYFEFRSDAFSAPYAMALIGFGILAGVMPMLIPGNGRQIAGGLAIACLGLVILAIIVWVYPELVQGPFPMISGLAKTHWFDRIHQEMPATFFFKASAYRSITFIALMLVTSVLAIPTAWRTARSGDAVITLIVIIAVAAVVTTLISNRALRLALAIVPLLLPVAIAVARDAVVSRTSRPRQAAVRVIPAAAVLTGFLSLFLVVPKGVSGYDAYDFLLMNACKTADYSVFGGLGTARVMAPPALGLRLVSEGIEGISVSSIPFHRASPPINAMLTAFRSTTPAGRSAYFEHFDYLAICKSPSGSPLESELPLFADLIAGRAVPGLVPLAGTGEILLFRIDHAAMR